MSERLYKTIDNELLKKLNIKSQRYYSISRLENGEFVNFELLEKKADKSNSYVLEEKDDFFTWDRDNESVFFNIKIQISNCLDLCGNNGVVNKDSTIGIGLVWHAEGSRIKKCEKIGEFKLEDDFNKFFKNGIELNELKSNVNFYLIFYVINPSKDETPCFANNKGIILGETLLYNLIGEGTGSMFPIFADFFKDDEKDILWKYNCDISDISTDDFNDDTLSFTLNKNHPLYQYYEVNNINYNKTMMNSLIADMLTVLIIDIRRQCGDSIDLSEPGNEGSVLHVLKYFNDKLNFDINGDYNKLLISIQKYIK